MKKTVLTLGSILLFAHLGDLQAKRVWFLNLTKEKQSLYYFKKDKSITGIDIGDWKKDSFSINGLSKSNGHEIGSSYTHFGKSRPKSKSGLGPTNSNVTVVRFNSANPANAYEEKIIDGSIYTSDTVKKLIYTYRLKPYTYKKGSNLYIKFKGKSDTKLNSYKDIPDWMLEKTIGNW